MMIKIKIVTGFPDLIENLKSINKNLAKSIDNHMIDIEILNLRSENNFHIDDKVFGGEGMALTLNSFDRLNIDINSDIYYLNPDGVLLNQPIVESMSQKSEIILFCGRYEGIDSRIIDKYKVCNVSIGAYVLSNGELAAMVLVDAIARLLYLDENTTQRESFGKHGMLDHDIYTRPYDKDVPKELISGNHKLLEEWKNKNSLIKTLFYNSTLLNDKSFSSYEISILQNIKQHISDILNQHYNEDRIE